MQATLEDGIAAGVIARKLQWAGMTTNQEIKYRKPVPTGPGIRQEGRAHIREIKRNFAFVSAKILYEGNVCSEAEMTYYCFSPEKSASDFYFSGCEVAE